MDFEHYRDMVEQAPIMLWRSGADSTREHFNATWLAFTGRSLEEELGSGWAEAVHPDDLRACLEAWSAHCEQRQPFEVAYRLRRFDGVYRHVRDRGSPRTDSAGAFVGFVGSCTETDEPPADRAPATRDELLEMSLDHICIAGLDGYWQWLNPSWTRTLGWTREELMSKPLIEFVHPDDREAVHVDREGLRRGVDVNSAINRYLCRDGTYRWFHWKSVANPGRGLVYAVARDITEQRLAEQRLEEAKAAQEKLQRQLVVSDRMASVGTLATGIAHEINNPLACVMANIAVMLEELGSPDVSPSRLTELREMANDAHAGAERIRKIVRGLKTFSRADEERRVVVDVQALLDLSINLTLKETRYRGARVVKDYGSLPVVEVDEARLGQVFIGLLLNAAQALPQGDSSRKEIRVVTSTDPQGRAVIEVRDTGAGIPARIIDRIFDPFFTTRPVGEGTGLGLSICHNIVSDMDGEITVTSEEGRGSTFRVVLPPASTARGRPEVEPIPLRESGARAAVLVVDDELAIGAVLRRVLRDHVVTVVMTAGRALELLATGERFDVIFSDLMMPEMSGMALHAQLLERFPEAAERVVFITGGAFTPAAKAYIEQVANPCVDKPFDPAVVRGFVERAIR